MSALSVGGVRRWSLRVVASAIFVAIVGAASWACSGSGGPPPQAADAPILVRTSDLFVTVENRAGLALVDIDVAILPAGSPATFTKFVDRLENGQKRDLSLGDFSGQGGTTFNLRMMRPRSVRVKAKDMVGKTYEVNAPW